LAESLREFKHLPVANQANDILCSFIDRSAVFAALQMPVESGPHFGHQVTFHVVDEFFPNLSAIDLYVLSCR